MKDFAKSLKRQDRVSSRRKKNRSRKAVIDNMRTSSRLSRMFKERKQRKKRECSFGDRLLNGRCPTQKYINAHTESV